MKCPKHTIPNQLWKNTNEPEYCTCREEECRMWSKKIKDCRLVSQEVKISGGVDTHPY